MLQQYIASERVRFYFYAVFAIVATAIAAAQIGFASAGVSAPDWVGVFSDVFVFVAGAFGWTAASHTKTPAPEPDTAGEHRPENVEQYREF